MITSILQYILLYIWPTLCIRQCATVCLSTVEISAMHGIHWMDDDTQKNLYMTL